MRNDPKEFKPVIVIGLSRYQPRKCTDNIESKIVVKSWLQVVECYGSKVLVDPGSFQKVDADINAVEHINYILILH